MKTLGSLVRDVFMERRDTIKSWLCCLDGLEGEIAMVCLETTGGWKETRSETPSEFEFRMSIYQDLSHMAEQFEDGSEVRNLPETSNPNSHVSTISLKPLMRALSFSVRGMEDKFAFENFLAHFENYI